MRQIRHVNIFRHLDGMDEFERVKLLDKRIAIAVADSPVSEFVTEVVETPKEKITFVTSDVSILFNQQRLAQMNPMKLQEWLQQVRSSGFDTSQFSDEELMQGIKSRYIQSQADVYNFSRALDRDMRDLYDRIAEQHELQMQQAAQQEPAQSSQTE